MLVCTPGYSGGHSPRAPELCLHPGPSSPPHRLRNLQGSWAHVEKLLFWYTLTLACVVLLLFFLEIFLQLLFRSYLHIWHSLFLVDRISSELNEIISRRTKKVFYKNGKSKVLSFINSIINQQVIITVAFKKSLNLCNLSNISTW